MESEKKMSPILIVILSVLGVCLVGFCVWYGVKSFKEDEKPIDEPSSNTVSDVINFPQTYDEKSVLLNGFYELLSESDVKTDFKNLKKEKNGNTFVYNCEKYLSNYSICTHVSLKINDEVSTENWLVDEADYDMLDNREFLNSTLDSVNETSDERSYKVGRYYIFHNYVCCGLDLNTITIYDKSNVVYKNDLVKTLYSLPTSFDTIYAVPTVVNNVLYFIQQPEGYSIDRVKYNTIDLSKDKIEVNLVKEFTGYISGEK